MNIHLFLIVILVVLAGAMVQGALGFGATMVTMGFLPLVMDYGKAMGLSIILMAFSTFYISFRLRKCIRWGVVLPLLIPAMIICGAVNLLSAKVSSNIMYLLLGMMFVTVSVFFFVFSEKIHIDPTPVSGTILGVICGICYGLFASGGPTAALYLLPSIDKKEEYLATMQAFLFCNNIMIVAISFFLGRLQVTDAPLIGAGLVGLAAGTALGLWIHRRIPANLFGKVIYAFVGIGGIWIIISHIM